MNRKFPVSYFLVAILFALFFVGCKGQEQGDYSRQTSNSIYYWRTTFDVSDSEQQFLIDNNVKRLYLRMFDVDMAKRRLYENLSPLPIATIQFPIVPICRRLCNRWTNACLLSSSRCML